MSDAFLARQPARQPTPGLGLAVARRTVFRPEDAEDWGRVAARVAAGNIALRGDAADPAEAAALRQAIASGALLTAGRHLQQGDATQPTRNIELFTNCATAITSFALLYLLLNGCGVGRAYDDALLLVDWAGAPALRLTLDPSHPDFPHTEPALAAALRAEGPPPGVASQRVADSREGWAEAFATLEAMAFRGARREMLCLDLSAIRPRGAPIAGMQGRPAPGPLALVRIFDALAREVIAPARAPGGMALWEQALRLDHILAAEVSAAGARRAARMASKDWRDAEALRFVRLKAEAGLWSANHALMVDAEFWRLAAGGDGDTAAAPARALFAAASESAWRTGEPGFINGDRLEDMRSGAAWRRPATGLGGARLRLDAAAPLVAALESRAARARFPVTTNPCGEVVLHVAGGYCVVADFAPLLACPAPLEEVRPGAPDAALAAAWDARVAESVRLGVRFLLRVNRMDGLYAAEIRRTNRIGIGPTGLHEWAWLRFGLGFRDLLDAEGRGAPFWTSLARLSALAKDEALAEAARLGQAPPLTVTTIKPAGTTAKLFGLTEGAHLPARRHHLRWVQFRGRRGADGRWSADADPQLPALAARGHPVRALTDRADTSIVAFPAAPLILSLGMGARLVTAAEATPAEHLAWLRLLEAHWIGAERGNQVSYTLPFDPVRLDLAAFRALLLAEQPRLRACAFLPRHPAGRHEYLPEEEVTPERHAALLAALSPSPPHGAPA
ncbi:MAG: recombinase [Rubritepida sp.]|nr:recombinase [Rubritepida sp.]